MNEPLHYNPWLIYQKQDTQLGKGSYGHTFLAKKRDDLDTLFCVKQIPIQAEIKAKFALFILAQ